MNFLRRQSGPGFTIVELIVVIAVIATLAVIATVSYGAWRTSISQSLVKSDLEQAASAMEAARNFDDGYPLTLPSSFRASEGVAIDLALSSISEYCIEGGLLDNDDEAFEFYLYSKVKPLSPAEGTCVDRPNTEPPDQPTSVAIVNSTGSSVSVAWPSHPSATNYTLECASDSAFIFSPKQTNLLNDGGQITSTITGLTPSSMFYCRVKAHNAMGESDWSATANVSTDNSYGSLAVGTSLDGYWTTAPQGYLLEDGSAVSRTTYADLFAIIGTTYGVGDGSTTFNLPDSRGRVAVNQSASDSEFATIGQKSGSNTELLTIPQLPSHTHTQNPHNHNHGRANPYVTSGYLGGTLVWTANGSHYGFYYGPSPSTAATNKSTGGSQAHNNIQPSIVKTSAIKFAVPDAAINTLPPGSSVNGYWSTAPEGYLLENGAEVSRSTYAQLFAVIGTTHGAGNGSTTFNLPDSRGRTGVNLSASDSEFNTIGKKSGTKREQISIAQMPSHTHVQNPHNHNNGHSAPYVTDGSFGGASVASAAAQYYGFRLLAAPNATAINNNTGSGQDHNNIQPAIVKMSAIKYTAESGEAGNPTPIGSSLGGYWPAAAPNGYLYEDGSAVSRSVYSNLFAVIGTTFGAGDGSTTFNLPDSRGRTAVNKDADDALFDTLGEKRGAKTHTLTINEMPSHTHTQSAHHHNIGATNIYVNSGNFGGQYAPAAPGSAYGYRLVAIPNVTATNNNTGSGQAHNNIMPSIVKRYVIKY